MPTYFRDRMELNVSGLRKFWTEHYYDKGLRFGKLQRTVDKKIAQRRRKLGY